MGFYTVAAAIVFSASCGFMVCWVLEKPLRRFRRQFRKVVADLEMGGVAGEERDKGADGSEREGQEKMSSEWRRREDVVFGWEPEDEEEEEEEREDEWYEE